MSNNGNTKVSEQVKIQDSLLIKKSKSVIGNLHVNTYDKKGKLLGQKDLGENLATNCSKMVMTHLIAQSASNAVGNMNNILAFEPRIWDSGTGGLGGGVTVNGSTFNPTAAQLKISRMAFGKNLTDDEVTTGANPDVEQYGLFNAVSKSGYSAESGSDYTVVNYFYGGTTTVYQFLRTTGGEVEDGIIRIIVRMATTEGQAGTGQIEYREAGLFTTLFLSNPATNGGTQQIPFMFARKTFAPITKTNDLELEFVWELRF